VKFLPIAERELRVAARRPATYWLRFFIAGGLLVLASWLYLGTRRAGVQEMGQVLFYVLTGGLGVYVLTAGVRSTADCLSEEKREGTLGLLFLTDLKGYDVVFGKLLANSLSVFYGVLAVLPILAVPLLMGGVTGAEFSRLALVVINTLFFSLSVGMLASAVCLRPQTALALTMLLILLAAVGGPALGLLEWRMRFSSQSYQYLFLAVSPAFPFFAGAEPFFRMPIGRIFYWSIAIIHAWAWVCLLLASWVVRHKWQDKPATAAAMTRRVWREEVLEGSGLTRHAFRTRLLDINAFFWLSARPRHRVLWSWIPLVAAVGIWIWGAAKLRGDWFNPGIYAATAFLLSATMRSMIGAEASRRVLEDRKIGSMELLLSTSLSIPEVLRGQWLTIRRLFTAPVTVMMACFLLMWVSGFAQQSHGERPYWFWVGIGGMVMFFIDSIALVWLGMWLGISVKNPRHAFGSAIAPILALPWAAVAVVMTAIAFLPYEFRHRWSPEVLIWILWFGFSMAADLGFGMYARHCLTTRFRETASQRFQIKPSWWKKLTGKGIS